MYGHVWFRSGSARMRVVFCWHGFVMQVLRRTALYFAVQAGHVHVVAALASDSRVDVNMQYLVEDGRTVFHMACLKGSAELVQCLADVPRLDVHAEDVSAKRVVHLHATAL
jgi:hypothetical protein